MRTNLLLVLVFTGSVLAAEPQLLVLAGVSNTFLAPDLVDLDYIGFDQQFQTRFTLWPTIGTEIRGIELGALPSGTTFGGGLVLHPLFLSKQVITQLNPDDTTHEDFDMALGGVVYAEYALRDSFVLQAGLAAGLHYWSYYYYYNSQISADTETFDSGTYTSLGLMFGTLWRIELGPRLTLPVSIRAWPVFAYGLMLPVSVSVGLEI